MMLPLACLLSACAPHRPASVSAVSGDVAKATDLCRAETAKAFDLIQQKKYAEAEPILKRAIEADSMYGPAHNDLGLVYYRINRPYEAAWEFENAIKLMPKQPEPRNNLGLVLENADKLTQALPSFTQAAQLDPANPEYLGNLARVRIRLGMRDDETKQILESLIDHDKRPEWIHWARYMLIRLQGPKIEDAPTTAPSAVK
ncbi:MAG TPA: tetratricopeptide repeat protein [Humisphaera sp.]|nr:tetratricopeptide repeat protein [Humisphaera sp.]